MLDTVVWELNAPLDLRGGANRFEDLVLDLLSGLDVVEGLDVELSEAMCVPTNRGQLVGIVDHDLGDRDVLDSDCAVELVGVGRDVVRGLENASEVAGGDLCAAGFRRCVRVEGPSMPLVSVVMQSIARHSPSSRRARMARPARVPATPSIPLSLSLKRGATLDMLPTNL